MCLFSLDDEAKRLITDYVNNVKARIRESGFFIEPEYLETRMFDLENYIKFFSVKHARKRKAEKVGIADVKYALEKFGKPEKFIKSHFKDSDTWAKAQRVTLHYLAVMKEKLRKVKEPMVLDAGCGWGRHLKRLSDCCAEDFGMIGVDLDDFSLQYGKTINEAAAFLKSDIQALPFNDQVFDIVLCVGVIHEAKKGEGRRRAIKELARVLKSGGMLYIADAFTKLSIVSILTRILQSLTPKVEWVFKKEQLEKMLHENGFKIVNVEKIRSKALGVIIGYTFTATKSQNTPSN